MIAESKNLKKIIHRNIIHFVHTFYLTNCDGKSVDIAWAVLQNKIGQCGVTKTYRLSVQITVATDRIFIMAAGPPTLFAILAHAIRVTSEVLGDKCFLYWL